MSLYGITIRGGEGGNDDGESCREAGVSASLYDDDDDDDGDDNDGTSASLSMLDDGIITPFPPCPFCC